MFIVAYFTSTYLSHAQGVKRNKQAMPGILLLKVTSVSPKLGTKLAFYGCLFPTTTVNRSRKMELCKDLNS